MENTGYMSFAFLEKYYTDDNTPTGEIKPNVTTDTDYLAPSLNTTICPPAVRYYNTQQTKTVAKNNCFAGETGTEVELIAYANQFVSSESIIDANNQAIVWLENNAQIYANNLGTCIADSTPPTNPVLSVSSITPDSLLLSWTASTDNGIVAGYDIYKNGVLLSSTSADLLSYTITGLSGSTAYDFYIKAKDASGNSSDSNVLTVTTLPSVLSLAAVKSVIFEKRATSWSESRDAPAADLQHIDNTFIGAGADSLLYYVNRYRGIIDTSSITIKPKSAQIKFKFAENTVGNALTFNLFAANILIPLNQAFQLQDWNDWDSTTFINSVSVPINSTAYNEINLTPSQLDLLVSGQAYNFFLISNGDKDSSTPGSNNRPVLSITAETGEIYLECKF